MAGEGRRLRIREFRMFMAARLTHVLAFQILRRLKADGFREGSQVPPKTARSAFPTY